MEPKRLVFQDASVTAVDRKIIEERNTEIKHMERDFEDMAEISKDLGVLLHEQGEMIEVALTNLHDAQICLKESKEVLAQAEIEKRVSFGVLADATAVALGVGVGAFGFFGGPVVGVPFLAVGAVVAGCFIFIRRNI